MQDNKSNSAPVAQFVERYMPGASREERAEAEANVHRLIAVLIQIDERLVLEERERDSRESEERGRVRGPDNKPAL